MVPHTESAAWAHALQERAVESGFQVHCEEMRQLALRVETRSAPLSSAQLLDLWHLLLMELLWLLVTLHLQAADAITARLTLAAFFFFSFFPYHLSTTKA